MPHVLYLSHEGMTDPLGRSQVLAYALELARMGFRFTVVSAEKPDRYAAARQEVEAAIGGLPVAWRPVPYANRPPFVGPWRTLRRIEREARNACRDDRPDLLHCRSLLMARIGQGLARYWKAPWLYDMRGFWPDERAEGGVWPPSHPIYGPLYRYFRAEERRLEREADHVVTLTERARDIVQERTGRPAESMSVVPCCVDLEWMQASRPESVRALRQELELPEGQPVIGYLGSLGGWYLAREMFDCFAAWRARRPMTFLVVTTDAPERVFALAEAAGLSRDDLRVRAASRADVPDFVQLMDAGLFFIRPCYSKQASSPTKLAEFLAAGKPVVTLGGTGDLDAQLAGRPFACVLRKTTAAEYERAFAALPALTTADPAVARSFAAENYSLMMGAERYAEAYGRMLGFRLGLERG